MISDRAYMNAVYELEGCCIDDDSMFFASPCMLSDDAEFYVVETVKIADDSVFYSDEPPFVDFACDESGNAFYSDDDDEPPLVSDFVDFTGVDEDDVEPVNDVAKFMPISAMLESMGLTIIPTIALWKLKAENARLLQQVQFLCNAVGVTDQFDMIVLDEADKDVAIRAMPIEQ